MTLTGRPLVGVVYKTWKGITFTEWYHAQAFNYPEPSVKEWLDDELWWNSKIGPHFNGTKVMCIVRAK